MENWTNILADHLKALSTNGIVTIRYQGNSPDLGEVYTVVHNTAGPSFSFTMLELLSAGATAGLQVNII
jgi:hypothetical protein